MILLDSLKSTADLRKLSRDELAALAAEMRARLIDVCSRTGGHIGAGLGVVELTIALHYVFETPVDLASSSAPRVTMTCSGRGTPPRQFLRRSV